LYKKTINYSQMLKCN